MIRAGARSHIIFTRDDDVAVTATGMMEPDLLKLGGRWGKVVNTPPAPDPAGARDAMRWVLHDALEITHWGKEVDCSTACSC